MKSGKNKGLEHPIHKIIQETRSVLLHMGFDEIENPLFIPEDDVYKQYGSEAPIILDRCYYLAGLPRPDIGLGKSQTQSILGIAPGFDFDIFTKTLRSYREGSIEGDDLAEQMVESQSISAEQAMRIIDLIPEFKSITPLPSKLTLRSHMTAAWYQTLAAMQKTNELPLKLFSIGLRFRREQKVDATHLRAHYGASCVIMDKELQLEEGKQISSTILSRLGFGKNSFIKKKATANYYEESTEYEIYSKNIEIADCGMYSHDSLRNYSIEYPVFNLGFGIERLLMIKNRKADIREVMYPQFYQALALTDEEIAKSIEINIKPETPEGSKLVQSMKEQAEKYADEASPCSFLVYSGELLGKDVEISLIEKEDNTMLLGPAALNRIYVYEGSIYSAPPEPLKLDAKLKTIKEKGVEVSFTYLDAVFSLFSAKIEEIMKTSEKNAFLQIKMAKTPGDINIKIGDVARRYITSQNRSIQIKGPVFTAIDVRIKE